MADEGESTTTTVAPVKATAGGGAPPPPSQLAKMRDANNKCKNVRLITTGQTGSIE